MNAEEIRAEAIEVIARADYTHIETEHAAQHQRPPRAWDDAPKADQELHRGLAVIAVDSLATAGLLPVSHRDRHPAGLKEMP